MNAFAMVADELTPPFTRVGSQVQSLPRPPLNLKQFRDFSGDHSWRGFIEYAEHRANKRRFSQLVRTNAVHANHPSLPTDAR